MNGTLAQVTSISPDEITAIAPPAGKGVTGSVDVEIDDQPAFYAAAIVYGGISYDAGTGDSLTLVTAPSGTVAVGVPVPFTVTALGSNLAPAGGATVTFTVATGTAALSCGSIVCTVPATGDGIASVNIVPVDQNPSIVTASLANGASLQAHFTGGTPPALSALTPTLSVAAGSSINWMVQALVLGNGLPMAGQTVQWKQAQGIQLGGSAAATTAATGIASKALQVGPLNEGQQASSSACLNGTSECVSFNALGARPEYSWMEAVSGTSQSLAASGSPALITIRVRDMNGNPMAGGTVTLVQSVYAWSAPCPPRGRCAQPQLLATQTATAVSGLDGTVTFAPASVPGTPTNVIGVAATGSTSTLSIAVEQHP